MSEPVTVGIDLGGTGLRVVALTLDGTVVRDESVPTPGASASTISAVQQLVESIRRVGGPDVLGVGIGASGPVDASGIIRNDDTLPAFSHVDLPQVIRAECGVRCVIDNDATTAAVGENHYGAGSHAESLLMVTLGTGIGVAVLTAGQPFRAGDGSHPEAGHLPVPGPAASCYCGLEVCWEQLASRTALDQLTGGQPMEWAARAETGDTLAATTFRSYGQRVGLGLGALLTIFRPDRVVLGGGAARFLPQFESGLRQSLARNGEFAWDPPIVMAELGALSGAIGAAVLAR